jgi:hypothetical protein
MDMDSLLAAIDVEGIIIPARNIDFGLLPAEVRDRILKYLLIRDDLVQCYELSQCRYVSEIRGPFNIRLLSTSRQMYSDGIRILYGSNVFTFKCAGDADELSILGTCLSPFQVTRFGPEPGKARSIQTRVALIKNIKFDYVPEDGDQWICSNHHIREYKFPQWWFVVLKQFKECGGVLENLTMDMSQISEDRYRRCPVARQLADNKSWRERLIRNIRRMGHIVNGFSPTGMVIHNWTMKSLPHGAFGLRLVNQMIRTVLLGNIHTNVVMQDIFGQELKINQSVNTLVPLPKPSISARTFHPFLRLPLELREKILEYCLLDSTPKYNPGLIRHDEQFDTAAFTNIAVLRLDRNHYQAMLPIFYHSNTFCFTRSNDHDSLPGVYVETPCRPRGFLNGLVTAFNGNEPAPHMARFDLIRHIKLSDELYNSRIAGFVQLGWQWQFRRFLDFHRFGMQLLSLSFDFSNRHGSLTRFVRDVKTNESKKLSTPAAFHSPFRVKTLRIIGMRANEVGLAFEKILRQRVVGNCRVVFDEANSTTRVDEPLDPDNMYDW